ncbi:la protein homolog [Sitodiplosis mosellana]|uniref:la protein homolog n=1 Tax=Sitodiplosis mosellana TaxID=263140 RepID=UPI00244513CB|nr:la protein homolog [Sitodiplosis mosellana]
MAEVKPIDNVVEEPEAKKAKLDAEEEEVKVAEPAEESTAVKTEKLEQDIIDQVEYYFGDANLFRDKFLQAETAKNEGWVPITTLTTFKRLASLSTDVKVIVDALDKSDSGLLEISEDRQSIRRHPERPLPEKNEETRKEIQSRTAYVKGFPKELEMPDFIEFFKDYPKVSHVVIRKYLDKPTKTYKSKGSVFVTFSTRDQCAAFLTQDIKHKDTDLITKWQSDYYAGKKTERQEQKKEKNAKLEPEIELAKGAVLLITEIKPDTTRDVIKGKIESLEGDVAFVEFKTGEERAYVRLSNENGAKDLLAKLDGGKLKLGENESPVSVLEGEDEEKYLADCVEKMKLRRKAGNRNNKFGSRKRKADN